MNPKHGEVWLADLGLAAKLRPVIVNVQGIGSMPPIRFEKKLGTLSEEDLLKIKQALMYACKL